MKLKNMITALFVMLVAFVGYSCTEDAAVETADTELSLSSTFFEATKDGGEETVKIESNGEWTVSQSEATDWMTISKTAGANDGEFTIAVDPNKTISSREVTLIVTSEEYSEIVLVKQLKGDEVLTVSPAPKLEIAKAACTPQITITANTIWDASVAFEDGAEANWMTMSTQTGSAETVVDLNITENPTVSPRTATISFLTVNGKYTYEVVQGIGDATITLGTLPNLAGIGDSKWVDVQSNNTWEATVVDAETNTWITLNHSTGSGEGSFEVRAESNPTAKSRVATVSVNFGGSEPATLEVTQLGSASEISVAAPVYANFDSEGGDATFTVTSNDTWTIVIPEDAQDWLTTADVDGEFDGTFKLSTVANAGDALSTTIKVVCDEDDTKFVEIPVAQTSSADDNALQVDITEYAAGKAGEFKVVEISGTEAWTAETDSSYFLTCTDAGAAGDDITLTIAANDTQDARLGAVTITSTSGIKRVITVSQEAGDATFSIFVDGLDDDNKLPAAGGTLQLDVKTNADSWFIVEWADWVIFKDGTYSKSQKLDFEIEENMGFDERPLRFEIQNITGLSNRVADYKQAASTGSLSLSEVFGSPFDVTKDVVKIDNVGGKIAMKVKKNVDFDVTFEYEADNEFSEWIETPTITDDKLPNVKVLSFDVKESENYTAPDETTDVHDTGYIVIKPTDAAAAAYPGVAGVEIKIPVTLGAFVAQEPTYAVSKIDATSVCVELENTKFKAGTTFANTDFEVAYTNAHPNSVAASGTLAISAIAVDAENPSKLILTTDKIFNTDEITISYVGTTDVILANTKTFAFESDVIAPTYVEYINEDFETEGAAEEAGWSAYGGTISAELPNYDLFADNPVTTGNNTSAKAFYVNGDGASNIAILSNPFKTVADGEDIIMTVDYMVPASVTGSDGFSFYYNSASAGAAGYSAWKSYWYCNYGQQKFDAKFGAGKGSNNWGWLGNIGAKVKDTWFTISFVVGPYNSAATDTNEVAGGDHSMEVFDDMRSIMYSNGFKGEFYVDNIRLGNADPRQ